MPDTTRSSTISDTTKDALRVLSLAVNDAESAAYNGRHLHCIDRLRVCAELVTSALASIDPELVETVRITDAGLAATESGFVPDETPTDIDHEIPTRTGALACPEHVSRFDLLTLAGAALGREKQYGPATDNFMQVAEMWSAILGTTVTTERVMLCMAALKMARLIFNPSHVDSWADLAGYAALGAEFGTLPVEEPATGAA